MRTHAWKILRINLTERTIHHQEVDPQTAKLYMQGAGVGARILYDETSPATDPLGPENIIVFMTGIFTGSTVPSSGRHTVISKSPLTGIYGESDIGGSWGTALKRIGYDGIVVTGKSERPVYLLVEAERTEIRDAAPFWGHDTYETDHLIKEELGKNVAVTCIGQAGERLSRIASIMSDGEHGRTAGRCGLGAVMGSKKLKAIVIPREKGSSRQDNDELKASVQKLLGPIKEKSGMLKNHGTAGQFIATELIGDLPIKNWRLGSWKEGAKKISGQAMTESILSGRYACRNCIIGCGRVVSVADSPYGPIHGAGPEYETLAGFGSMCLVDDLPMIAKANEFCNRHGFDTISAGNIAAFAMEAYENNLLTKKDLDGIDLTWGNPKGLLELLQKIGQREGIGELLSEGTRIAAAKIGGQADQFAMHVKGLEFPMHDPRAFSSLAVAYATSRIGASHWAATHVLEARRPMPELGYTEILDRFTSVGKGVMTARVQDYTEALECLKICKFIAWIPLPEMLDWARSITGEEMNLNEYRVMGERLSNLKRMYNVRHGITRKDDSLPKRILTEKRGEGGTPDHLPDLEQMLNEYYRFRGWDENGIPTKEKLQSLGLEELAIDKE